MDITIEGFLRFVFTIAVGVNLPKLASRFIPKSVGKFQVPKSLALVAQLFIAYFLSGVLWTGLIEHANTGRRTLGDLVNNPAMEGVAGLFPGILLAFGTLLMLYLAIKAVIDSLQEPSDFVHAAIALAVVFMLFTMDDQIWGVFEEYWMRNLQGSAGFMESDPVKEIRQFFAPPD